ncbi:hypothetical protein AWZ03_014725, partial [Drosophila navojoa]
MRCYLEGYRFDIVTDHLALKWLNSTESPTDRIARWALELQQYQFDERYRRENLNVVNLWTAVSRPKSFKSVMKSSGVTLQHTTLFAAGEPDGEAESHGEDHESAIHRGPSKLVGRATACDNAGGQLECGRLDGLYTGILYIKVTPGSATKETQPEAKEDKMKEVFDSAQTARLKASAGLGGSIATASAVELAPKFDGPYKVVKVISPNVVRLLNCCRPPT